MSIQDDESVYRKIYIFIGEIKKIKAIIQLQEQLDSPKNVIAQS